MIRVAIVGLGGMGRTHACDLINALGEGYSGYEVVLGIDFDPAARAAFESRCNVPTSSELVGDFDALIVTTPHYQHFPNAACALPRYCHVLVEKPLAMNLLEGQLLCSVAKPEQIFATCQHKRADGRWKAIRTLIQRGGIGEIHNVELICKHAQASTYADESQWRADPAKSGGGILVDTGNHLTDLALWILGEVPFIESVQMEKRNGIDLLTFVRAQLSNGAEFIATYDATYPRDHYESLSFWGGTSVAQYHSDGHYPFEDNCFRYDRIESEPDGVSPARNFIRAIQGIEPVQAPAVDALRVLAFTDAVYAKGGTS